MCPCGGQPGRKRGKDPLCGESMAVDAQGTVVGGPFLGEGVFIVDVEREKVYEERARFPTKEDRREFVYRMMGIEEV